jgi:DNA-binding SARP family transcriptional activator
MIVPAQPASRLSVGSASGRPRLELRLLGGFRLLKDAEPVAVRHGGKAEVLLLNLALQPRLGVEREELLATLWPNADEALASQSLDTLVHSLRKTAGDALDGAGPVVRSDGRLRLNVERGIRLDVAEFEREAAEGDRLRRTGEEAAAVPRYEEAVRLYAGDLVIGSEIRHLLERERLRARYLELLRSLAETGFGGGQYTASRDWARALLGCDPCREDAHRMVMRCDVRLGERAQALRQYQTCAEILRREFGVEPEPATHELYEAIRLSPATV